MSYITLSKAQTAWVCHMGPTPTDILLDGDQITKVLAEHAGGPLAPPASVLVVAQAGSAIRRDGLVPAGMADTVTLPLTGHTLSLPQPSKGELFVGYCQRVATQAGGDVNAVGALFLGTAPYFERFGGFKVDGSNWPLAADYFFNPRAYMTPAELAADDQAKAGWKPVEAAIAAQQAPAAPLPAAVPVVAPVEIPIRIEPT